jgi:hypothetical protein
VPRNPGRNWSHTLGGDLKTCLRRTYYRVYGSWGGWSPESDPEARALYIAKQSSTLFQYGGSLVHEAVQRILERHRAGLPMADNDTMVDRIEERMKAEITYSMQLRWKSLWSPKRATLILSNHLQGTDLPITDIRDAVARYRACLRNFLENHLPGLLEVGPRRWVIIDSLDRIRHRDFDLFMVPDLTHHDRTDWVITDWKTGDKGDIEQVEAYGLYLQRYRKRDWKEVVAADNIIVRSVPLLNTDGVLEKRLHQDDIDRAMARINADLDRLEELEPYGLNKDKSAFPRTEHRGYCEGCVYRHVCEEDPQ